MAWTLLFLLFCSILCWYILHGMYIIWPFSLASLALLMSGQFTCFFFVAMWTLSFCGYVLHSKVALLSPYTSFLCSHWWCVVTTYIFLFTPGFVLSRWNVCYHFIWIVLYVNIMWTSSLFFPICSCLDMLSILWMLLIHLCCTYCNSVAMQTYFSFPFILSLLYSYPQHFHVCSLWVLHGQFWILLSPVSCFLLTMMWMSHFPVSIPHNPLAFFSSGGRAPCTVVMFLHDHYFD